MQMSDFDELNEDELEDFDEEFDDDFEEELEDEYEVDEDFPGTIANPNGVPASDDKDEEVEGPVVDP
ncbi:MAG: hypothetical protein ACI9HK_001293 [Pirellulaceae bacterium]|jgi:hypothetical protein